GLGPATAARPTMPCGCRGLCLGDEGKSWLERRRSREEENYRTPRQQSPGTTTAGRVLSNALGVRRHDGSLPPVAGVGVSIEEPGKATHSAAKAAARSQLVLSERLWIHRAARKAPLKVSPAPTTDR